MTWTAKLISAKRRDDRWKITVEFSDGSDIRTEAYEFLGSTSKELKAFIRKEGEKLTRVKIADFSAFEGKEIDITPPVVPAPDPPTEAEIAKATWFSDWNTLVKLSHLSVNGLIQSSDTRITDLQTSLISGWENSYLEDI